MDGHAMQVKNGRTRITMDEDDRAGYWLGEYHLFRLCQSQDVLLVTFCFHVGCLITFHPVSVRCAIYDCYVL